jgi:hypothetical protein
MDVTYLRSSTKKLFSLYLVFIIVVFVFVCLLNVIGQRVVPADLLTNDALRAELKDIIVQVLGVGHALVLPRLLLTVLILLVIICGGRGRRGLLGGSRGSRLLSSGRGLLGRRHCFSSLVRAALRASSLLDRGRGLGLGLDITVAASSAARDVQLGRRRLSLPVRLIVLAGFLATLALVSHLCEAILDARVLLRHLRADLLLEQVPAARAPRPARPLATGLGASDRGDFSRWRRSATSQDRLENVHLLLLESHQLNEHVLRNGE